MKVTDWVQAGRYAAALDPATALGGPTSEPPGFAKGGITPGVTSREVRVANANAVQGVNVTIPVTLQSLGDENALGFTLNFNPAHFHVVSIALGSGASGATTNINAAGTATGRLGMILSLPGTTFAAGSREVAKVTFSTVSPTVMSSSVSFTNGVVLLSVSDTNAMELPTDFTSGLVAINAKPSLQINVSGGNATLSWPVWAEGFNLQACGSNTPASGNWTNMNPATQTNSGVVSTTFPLPGEAKYFRLNHP